MTRVVPRGAPLPLRALSVVVDAVFVAVCGGVGLLIVPPAPWIGGVALALVGLAVLVLWRQAWGSSIGHEIVRLRTVW
ncbi:MAG: hypothetical protein ACTHZX_02165, partial [Microbacterium sp.]